MRSLLWGRAPTPEFQDKINVQDIINVIERNHLGNVASLLSLVTFVGFGLALWRIRKTETAAKQARRAAESVRDQLLQLNGAIRTLEDIRRLHRIKAWEVLPDRYTALRLNLIAIRGRTPSLSDQQRSGMQATIQQLSNLEQEVEIAMSHEDAPSVHLINTVSTQIDRLALILVELQNQIERPRY
jgi:hypothetical protein